MKKSLCCVLLVFLLLSGCDKMEKETDSQTSFAMNSNQEVKSVSNSLNRSLFLHSAGNENGYYDFRIWPGQMYEGKESSPWIHHANIFYIDYSTNTRIYLCNTPGCTHNNESCTSYIRFPRSLEMFMNSTGTRLFCMATGAMDNDIYSDEDLGRIYELELNGSSRKEILKVAANESLSFQDPIFAAEDYLYVVVYVYTATEDPKKELREIDLITGEVRVLRNLSMSEFLISSYENNIVFGSSVKNGTDNFVLSLSDGSVRTVYQYTFSPMMGGMLSPGSCSRDEYKAIFEPAENENEGVLIVINMKSGEVREFTNMTINANVNPTVVNFFDGKVHLIYPEPNGPSHEYIIDIHTGEMTERTLFLGGSGTKFVQILAETKDSFLVMNDVYDTSITMIDREGIPHTFDVEGVPKFAMISKSDYYSNIPNYTEIDDRAFS